MSEEQLKEFILGVIAEHLRIDLKTTSEYTGGMDGSGQMYQDSHTIRLMLDGEVISSEYLS